MNDSITFQELIKYCCDKKSQYWQESWRLLINRYKMHIYKVVYNRCQNWRINRLKRQFSDVVNDIVADVFSILFESLSSYKHIDEEGKFLYWLAAISNRSSSRYLQHVFVELMMDCDISEIKNYIHKLDMESRWELYENLVEKLRRLNSKRRRNLERDINIFMMYIWADFSDSMILSSPHCVNLGNRVIDNVISRLRKSLQKNPNIFKKSESI